MLSHLLDISTKMRIAQLHHASFSCFAEEGHKEKLLDPATLSSC